MFYFLGLTDQIDPRSSHCWCLHTTHIRHTHTHTHHTHTHHTHTHTPHTHTHTAGRTPLEQWSGRRTRRYLHSIQQTQQTNIQALRGIRICDLSNLAASDVILGPCEHWVRPILGLYWCIINTDCVCVWDPLCSSLHPVRPLRDTFFVGVAEAKSIQ
jgi:hypothetical protein